MSIFFIINPAIYRDLEQCGWCFFSMSDSSYGSYGVRRVTCSSDSILEMPGRSHTIAMRSPSGLGNINVWWGNATGTMIFLFHGFNHSVYVLSRSQPPNHVAQHWCSRTSPTWFLSSFVMDPDMSVLGPSIKCVFHHFIVVILFTWIPQIVMKSYLTFTEMNCESQFKTSLPHLSQPLFLQYTFI